MSLAFASMRGADLEECNTFYGERSVTLFGLTFRTTDYEVISDLFKGMIGNDIL